MAIELYPHQIPMVARHVALLHARGVTSDRSETGVGKIRVRGPAMEPFDRFVTFLEDDPERGCWLWTGRLKDGYGTFKFKGKMVQSPRWAYEYFREPIPAGLQIDHLCCNRACANPWHLEAVTQKENIQRGRNWLREKTHCPQGHSYADAYVYDGERHCRLCRRDWKRRYRAERSLKG